MLSAESFTQLTKIISLASMSLGMRKGLICEDPSTQTDQGLLCLSVCYKIAHHENITIIFIL